MKYIRHVEPEWSSDGASRNDFLANWDSGVESCFFVECHRPVGAQYGPLHRHSVDQFYFVMQGCMGLLLGQEESKVPPNSFIYIPAGLPHMNWNAGFDKLSFLELFVPSPMSISSIGEPVTAEQAEISIRTSKSGWVQTLNAGDISLTNRSRIVTLIDREAGSDHAAIAMVVAPPGASGPGLHIHRFDQFYYVLDGTLNVEIGLDSHRVRANSLVVLPAGVPHRNWNEDSIPERHLIISVPEPSDSENASMSVSIDIV
jgi:mannose-6-phosphate isomerase-like protein (cupin superfamily)